MSSTDIPSITCGGDDGADTFFGLRVASIFIILLGSSLGALFPVLAKQSKRLNMPKIVFDSAKYFGSGVIIATAFIHLLSPALDSLGSPCLPSGWSEYPFALALCLLSIFFIFIVELVAFRVGTAKLAKMGIHHDPHGSHVSHVSHGTESEPEMTEVKFDRQSSDLEAHQKDTEHAASVEIVGIAILEFGVVLHSVLVGLTLAVDPEFKVLFAVLVFHQTFEGLGVGSRLAYLKLPEQYNYVPIVAALLFGVTTPIGIAIGLGVKSTYNPNSSTALIVSGVLDSLSAGILIYTGLVELLAHEFLFNKEMINASNQKLAYAITCVLLGCGVMALLGRWS